MRSNAKCITLLSFVPSTMVRSSILLMAVFFVVETPWMILLLDYWRVGATHHSSFVMLKWHAILEIFKHFHHLMRNIEDKLYQTKQSMKNIAWKLHAWEWWTKNILTKFSQGAWFTLLKSGLSPIWCNLIQSAFLQATWDLYISSNYNLVDLSFHHELAW
jgi:hypothetical protein